MMNLDLLKADAFALSKAAFQREVVAAAGVLDFPADSKIESVGMVDKEKNAIKTSNFLEQNTFYVTAQPRASLKRQSMRIFTDANRDGDFEERTYLEANPDFSSSIIQPALSIDDIPLAARVLSQLTVGQQQSAGKFPQFLTIGADAYARFNGFEPQTVGSSFRAAAHNIFGFGAPPGTGEDFPFIRELYVTINDSSSTQLLGLVDSEGFTGAISIKVDPGPATVLDVDSTWYPRRDIFVAAEPETAFLAYSSMFWKDERYTPLKGTDEAHDLDRLVVGFDTTDDLKPETVVTAKMQLPRQIGTVPIVSITKFEELYPGRPVFVALDNRDQDPAHYTDYDDAKYAKRDSYAFEILHSDIDLGLHLFEQSANSEYHDNIVVAATILADLHPVASAADGIHIVSRHHGYVPTDSNGDGITDLLAGILGAQPVQQVDHARQAKTLLVPSQYTTIQAAINAAGLGDRIEVAAGVYTENLTIAQNDLRIVGAGAGQTILQAVASSSVPVVQFHGVDRSVIFSGFTVRNGHSIVARQGGGIDILNAAPVIENTEITANDSQAVGGGITIRGNLSNPLIQQNQIHHNQTRKGEGNFAGLGGGIYLGDGARAEIRNNWIHHNWAWKISGGIYSGPLTAGGTLMSGGGSVVIQGNLIEHNTVGESGHAGGLQIQDSLAESQALIQNNLIVNNGKVVTGDDFAGSGISVLNSNHRLLNNTFSGNAVYAIEVVGASPAEVRDNVVVNNGFGIRATTASVLVYNDVWGNTIADYDGPDTTPGSGSISADPGFINPSNANYRLAPGSPAINAGDPDSAYSDKDGTRNDMGAYGGPTPFDEVGIRINPDIEVRGAGRSIVNGDTTPYVLDHTVFAVAAAGGGLTTRTFSILNVGASGLSLAGSPRVTVTGPNAGDFTITAQPAAAVAALGGTTTFTVSFAPKSKGSKSAVIHIASNDAEENPFSFSVQGMGTNTPPSITNATTAANTQTTSGLIISRIVADSLAATHFKITNITHGTLFLHDGTTRINNGDFILYCEANAGLKFTPANGFIGTSHFTVQTSTSDLDAGLVGGTAVADITVTGLTLGNQLWIDANANRTFEFGTDFPVGNATLTLFRGNGTTIVTTTTTNGGGAYQFTNLPPGDYIVRVDAANFGVGQPLFGLVSISGSTDPDNNINHDDNGVDNAVSATSGIRSLAITLALGTEPTGPGSHTNYSLDFGFALSAPSLNPIGSALAAKPTLSWQPVPGATRYEIWFSRTFPYVARVYLASNVTTTSWSPPAAQGAGLYRYWVRAFDAANHSSLWSAPKSFQVRPTLISPLTGSFTKRPTFQWVGIPFASSYQLFLRSSVGDQIISNISGTSYTPAAALPPGTVQWWIRATGSPGATGWSYAGNTNSTPQAVIIGPTSPTTSSPTIAWNLIPGVGHYILHVQRVSNGMVVIRQDNLLSNRYIPPTPLAAGTYRAWVKAVDTTTNSFRTALWSLHFDFTVAASASELSGDPLDSESPADTEDSFDSQILDAVMGNSALLAALLE